jgi:hypothetical protein
VKHRWIAEIWDDYAEHVLPSDAPPVQVQETRRAFYFGVNGLFGLLMNGLDEDSEPTDADLAKMSDIQDELKQFVKDVEAGRR